MILTTPHNAVWFLDTEYQHPDGERDQRPICLVAHELYSGQTIRLWEDDLRKCCRAPFDVGENSIVVVYGAFAEIGTFRARGWPSPARVLDLYPEFRRQNNDAPHKTGSLIAALEHFGLPHMSVQDKTANRRLITDQNSWTCDERRRILGYCESDVDALRILLPALIPNMDCDVALANSEYMCAVADINLTGIPMDVPVLQAVQERWDTIRDRIIADVNEQYGTYEGGKWSTARFENCLAQEGITIWPTSEKTGRPLLDQDVFKEMSRIYPQLNLLREARGSLGKVRPVDLDVGSDNRCRSALYPFSTITGRNAPKKFPFMPATWTRSFIRPEPGRAIAYCDWSGQELAIAAAFSHDANMMDSYATGDFYLATAKAFGLAPADATAATHAAVRSLAKIISLGLNYGMSAYGLAHRLDIGYAEAEDLVAKHRAAYPNFWAFSDGILDTGMLDSKLTSVFGWSYSVTGVTNPRSLRNWHLQAAGGDMLRLAVVAMVAAGISISAPVHDAVLIEAADTDIEEHVAVAKALMIEASTVVTGGFPLRVDAHVFADGRRYRDARGVPMWNRVARMMQASSGGLA